MSWFKEYGFSAGGVLIGAFIAAQTGFNLGVEARVNATAAKEPAAVVEAARPVPQINPHTD